MSRREGKGPPPRDLLVCFPARAHLALMPKSTCSPRRHAHSHNFHQKHLRKSMRGGGGSSRGGHASPYLLSGTKQMGSDNLSEPTSPKVTCAGQIKVRPSTRPCKNWQTVMEEIERIHNSKKKKPTWMEAFGFKKEVMQFLSCLRSIKFEFRCLGALSHVDISSDDEHDDEDTNDKQINQDQDHNDHNDCDIDEEVSSRTVFSKWFMVLQENQDCGVYEKDDKSLTSKETLDPPCMPPANALLLMRCRSAPAKSWMEEKEEEEKEEEEEEEEEEDDDDDNGQDQDHDEEQQHVDIDEKIENKRSKRKSLMELMKNEEGDFYKLSIDIAKETWVIGGIHKDPFTRSRSWKR